MKPEIHNLIRPHYLSLDGYVSAGMQVKKDDSKVFLNANENPYPLPGLEGLNRYPEPQPAALAEAYARAYGVDADQIVMTRGADEALVILTKLFCEPHKDAIVICPPTFGMYAVDARGAPADVVEVPLVKNDGTFALDRDGIINAVRSSSSPRLNHSKSGQVKQQGSSGDSSEAADIVDPVRANSAMQNANGMTGSVKLVYICSPNNPTGTSFDHVDILGIAAALEGDAIVVVDETYAEFSAQGSICEDLETAPNLIVLRTLSKSYAFAGMRMGCFISADTDFIAMVKAKALDAYPLPQASIEAAFHVLSLEISAIAAENRAKLLAERDRIIPALQDLPFVKYIYPSDANFFLVEFEDAKAVCEYCAENNVILRDFSDKPLTENCLRISVGTEEENDKLLKLLQSF